MERKLEPCISLDLETSGLDTETDTVFQVGMVLETGDLSTAPEDLPCVNFVVKPVAPITGNPYALWLNNNLLGIIAGTIREDNPDYELVDAKDLLHLILSTLVSWRNYLDKDLGLSFPDGKPQILSKNGEKMDIPMLNNFAYSAQVGHEWGKVSQNWFRDLISHRSLDVGSIWAPILGRNASLKEINKLTGRPEVTHDALIDAIDNVYALREAFKRAYSF